MNKIKLSKAVEISGKSRIFFNYNHLTKKDESGDICVECEDLKKVINDEFINAKEHLHRFEIYQNQNNK